MTVSVYVRGFVALVCLAFCSVAISRDLGQDEALRLREQGVILPLEQVLRKAIERYPDAKLLEVELEEDDDIYVYEVELLTPSGVVRELKLNAADGQLLKDKVDD
ncbi:PepSY domain-containing protein [Pseudomonas psychrophila]|uniref:PepSY domain-containing protein n=1 Tax=Pseudomonas psychrophila TaxID=122355 RepID=UPI00047493EB|nr:PepSY domain-containing protein [Pseudomonas psychrophila]